MCSNQETVWSRQPPATDSYQSYRVLTTLGLLCCAIRSINTTITTYNKGRRRENKFSSPHLNVTKMLIIQRVTVRWHGAMGRCLFRQSICCQGQYYNITTQYACPGHDQYRLYNIGAQCSLSWSTHITATSYFCPNLWPRERRRKLTRL